MFKKIRQYLYIKKIRKVSQDTSLFRFLTLNGYKSQAAFDLMKNKISLEFYENVFCGGDLYNHYTKVNSKYITNYKFFSKTS